MGPLSIPKERERGPDLTPLAPKHRGRGCFWLATKIVSGDRRVIQHSRRGVLSACYAVVESGLKKVGLISAQCHLNVTWSFLGVL